MNTNQQRRIQIIWSNKIRKYRQKAILHKQYKSLRHIEQNYYIFFVTGRRKKVKYQGFNINYVVISEGFELLYKDLDIRRIIRAIHDIDRLKRIYFTKEELLLFNSLNNPVVEIDLDTNIPGAITKLNPPYFQEQQAQIRQHKISTVNLTETAQSTMQISFLSIFINQYRNMKRSQRIDDISKLQDTNTQLLLRNISRIQSNQQQKYEIITLSKKQQIAFLLSGTGILYQDKKILIKYNKERLQQNIMKIQLYVWCDCCIQVQNDGIAVIKLIETNTLQDLLYNESSLEFDLVCPLKQIKYYLKLCVLNSTTQIWTDDIYQKLLRNQNLTIDRDIVVKGNANELILDLIQYFLTS